MRFEAGPASWAEGGGPIWGGGGERERGEGGEGAEEGRGGSRPLGEGLWCPGMPSQQMPGICDGRSEGWAPQLRGSSPVIFWDLRKFALGTQHKLMSAAAPPSLCPPVPSCALRVLSQTPPICHVQDTATGGARRNMRPVDASDTALVLLVSPRFTAPEAPPQALPDCHCGASAVLCLNVYLT